mgnify:CR=1 FL=1
MRPKTTDQGTTHEMSSADVRALHRAYDVVDQIAFIHRGTDSGVIVGEVASQLKVLATGELPEAPAEAE